MFAYWILGLIIILGVIAFFAWPFVVAAITEDDGWNTFGLCQILFIVIAIIAFIIGNGIYNAKKECDKVKAAAVHVQEATEAIPAE